VIRYYYGCWRETGHDLFLPGEGEPGRAPYAERRVLTRILNRDWAQIDGGFHAKSQRDGAARLTHVSGPAIAGHCVTIDGEYWHSPGQCSAPEHRGEAACCTPDVTVLAIWERTVDARPGSHSTFVLEGHLDFGAAVQLAREAFPHVWSRLDAAGLCVAESTVAA
jgi:hypothetical protein